MNPLGYYQEDFLKPELLAQFVSYFGKDPNGPCNENIISDESLFRDYSRLCARKVDFDRVRNPFTLSKYNVSSYEKTWFIQSDAGIIDGPYNSYDMDAVYKKESITRPTLIGISKEEFFTF